MATDRERAEALLDEISRRIVRPEESETPIADSLIDLLERALAPTDAEREAMREVRTRANEMKDALCAACLIDWKDLDGDLREDAMRTVDAYKAALARLDAATGGRGDG